MNIKSFCDSIMRIYLYADMIKAIHLSTDIHWEHEFCDEAQEKIRGYVDQLCEQVFGYYGKPKFSDFTLKLDVYDEENLVKIFERIGDILSPIKTECEDIKKLSGTVSLIDDFNGTLSQFTYLCSFDKISKYKTKK